MQGIDVYKRQAWDWDLGGLVWCEQGLTDQATEQELERGLSANACCILVNAWLYQLTGEKSYLEWADRFYQFCKQMQDPVTKIYYNGVHTLLQNSHRQAGDVNKDLYSYNSGSMISVSYTHLDVYKRQHYNLGNELGIAQAAWFEYTLQDGMSFEPLPDFEKAVRRIDAYAETLQAQGYSLDFAPVCLSGNMTDNSPPSLRILDFIDRYQSLGKAVTLKMATLDEFFDALEKSGASIPAYRGDWTDWWADGVGSTPADVMQYRASARSYHIVQKLDPEGSITPAVSYTHLREALERLFPLCRRCFGFGWF